MASDIKCTNQVVKGLKKIDFPVQSQLFKTLQSQLEL